MTGAVRAAVVVGRDGREGTYAIWRALEYFPQLDDGLVGETVGFALTVTLGGNVRRLAIDKVCSRDVLCFDLDGKALLTFSLIA